jgi:hypothetical protein
LRAIALRDQDILRRFCQTNPAHLAAQLRVGGG